MGTQTLSFFRQFRGSLLLAWALASLGGTSLRKAGRAGENSRASRAHRLVSGATSEHRAHRWGSGPTTPIHRDTRPRAGGHAISGRTYPDRLDKLRSLDCDHQLAALADIRRGESRDIRKTLLRRRRRRVKFNVIGRSKSLVWVSYCLANRWGSGRHRYGFATGSAESDRCAVSHLTGLLGHRR